MPAVFNDPPTYTSLAIPAPPNAINPPVDTDVALVILLVYNAPDVLTFVIDPLPNTILLDVELLDP